MCEMEVLKMLSGSGYEAESKFHLLLYRTKKPKGRKTNIYIVKKESEGRCGRRFKIRLGAIKWSGKWRQFVFEPDNDTIWSKGCLEIINQFLDDKNKRHRAKIRKHKKR